MKFKGFIDGMVSVFQGWKLPKINYLDVLNDNERFAQDVENVRKDFEKSLKLLELEAYEAAKQRR